MRALYRHTVDLPTGVKCQTLGDERPMVTTFPDIADYAFLSDCEISTLIAPDGSVEWLCLPRPDSPSVFGALLDHAAGNFRFGPSGIDVPEPAALRPRHQRARDHLAHAHRLGDRVGSARDGSRAHRRTARPVPARARRHDGSGNAPAHRDVLRRPGRGAGQLRAAVRLRARERRVDLRRRWLREGHLPLRRPRARPHGQHAPRHPRPAHLRPHDARGGRVGVAGACRGKATRRPHWRRRRRSATPPRSTGATGWRWRRSTTTCGVRTWSAARWRSSR